MYFFSKVNLAEKCVCGTKHRNLPIHHLIIRKHPDGSRRWEAAIAICPKTGQEIAIDYEAPM